MILLILYSVGQTIFKAYDVYAMEILSFGIYLTNILTPVFKHYCLLAAIHCFVHYCILCSTTPAKHAQLEPYNTETHTRVWSHTHIHIYWHIHTELYPHPHTKPHSHTDIHTHRYTHTCTLLYLRYRCRDNERFSWARGCDASIVVVSWHRINTIDIANQQFKYC